MGGSLDRVCFMLILRSNFFISQTVIIFSLLMSHYKNMEIQQ